MSQKTHYVKPSILPKLTYRFSILPMQIPAGVCVEIDKLFRKVIWKAKKPRIF